MSNLEQRMGDHFEKSCKEQRIFRRAFYAMAGITAGAGSINYFMQPDERMTYTVVPLAGSVAICGLAKLYDRVYNSLQDTLIAHGTQDFPDTFEN